MKKFLLLVLAFAFIASTTTELDAQAKRYLLFEHFTQASCGPCASQNPIFQPIYEANKISAHHVAFHTSWPGVDEMYSYNSAENAAQTSYHGVSGVPNMVVNGTNVGSPVSVNQPMIDGAGQSPIRVRVEETNDGTTVSGTVTVQVLEDPGASNYVLRVAAVEELIEYASPPGSNGELDFPNVFRQFLANGQVGESISLVPGQDVTFDFSYDIDMDAWQPHEMYTLAWVSDETTKEVLNSGRAADAAVEVASTEVKPFQKGEGSGNKFAGQVNNLSSDPVEVTISMTADHPSDWSASYSFMGNDYTTTESFMVPSGIHDVTINATAGSLAGIGAYSASVEITGVDGKQNVSYSLISGVTDLVIHRNDDRVDLVGTATPGLNLASNDSYAAIGDMGIDAAFADGTLDGVLNVYYNIGWNFPAFNDEMVGALATFMDNGGNLFLSGQDIGWDLMSGHAQANGTPAQAQWFTDYLQTAFLDDGDQARSSIIGNTNDAVFGLSGVSPVTRPYGATAIYPDRLAPASGSDAQPIFHYNNAAETAGIRLRTNDYKVVYLGIGIEQFGSAAVRNQTVKLAHDWFYGMLSDTEFDNAMAALSMGQSFPNPADMEAIIPFEGAWEKDMMVRVTDLNGRLLATKAVAQGATQITINTSQMAEGIYFYQLTDGVNLGTPQKLVVMH